MDARQPLVLVADPIAEEGLAILRQHARVETVTGNREALEHHLTVADALVVRIEDGAVTLEHVPLAKTRLLDVDIPRPRDLSVKRTPVFLELVDAIWKMIEEEVKAALEMTASGRVESKALATY